jgi:S1-C subfamily serine protease
MDDERDPSTTGARTPDADRILDYVHGRYRRRKRIQQGSLAVMTVLIVAVASVAVINNLRSPSSVRVIESGRGPHGRVPSLSCGGGTPSDSRSLGTRGIASKVVDAVVNLTRTMSGGGEGGDGGMIVSPTGEMLTSNNSIADATSIKVVIGGKGGTHSAHVVGYDVVDDIALLQIDGVSNLKTVPVGDSSKVKVGDPVVAIGNDGGASPLRTVRGKVTALNQPLSDVGFANGGSATYHGMIQSRLRVPMGGGGGPLVNAHGEVIGMNVAEDSSFSFAITNNDAATVVAQICSGYTTDKVHIGPTAMLGVQVNDSATATTVPGGGANAPASSGATVITVEPNSAAASAGIKTGDTITSINGKSIANSNALHVALTLYHPNDRINVRWVDTAGARHTAAVKLGVGPPG